MTLTPRLVAEVIRQRLGLPDNSMAAQIMLQVPEALKATGRKIAASPDLRQLLITDPSSTSAVISSGAVDLTTPYSSFRFLMEYFDLGLVYLLPSTVVTPVESPPSAASGTLTFLGNPPHEDEITINGATPCTFYIPQISVVGSGSGAGSYAYQGIYNGRRFYNKVGEAVNPLQFSIAWGLDGDAWFITSGAGALLYTNEGEDVVTPDLSSAWAAETGLPPEPTVTALAVAAPNVAIGLTVNETAANFAAALLAATDPLLTVASYASSANVVTVTYRTAGTAGNAFTITDSVSQVIEASGGTLAGGAAASFRLSIPLEVDGLEDLVRVRFTTTVTLPTGITALTDYYITDYEDATAGDRGTAASFTISAVSDGSVPNPITTAGSGVLTMTLMDIAGSPLQRLKSPMQAALPRYLDSVFTYFYIQGNELFVLPDSVEGSVAFAVPSYPTNLAAMPESEEAERIFLDKLYELVLPAVNDAAQDGEK